MPVGEGFVGCLSRVWWHADALAPLSPEHSPTRRHSDPSNNSHGHNAAAVDRASTTKGISQTHVPWCLYVLCLQVTCVGLCVAAGQQLGKVGWGGRGGFGGGGIRGWCVLCLFVVRIRIVPPADWVHSTTGSPAVVLTTRQTTTSCSDKSLGEMLC